MTLPIASCRRCTASSSRSAPRLNGESSDSQRISSTHERPMPAITRWSRSSECRWRGRGTRFPRSSTGGGGSASGPSVTTISSFATSPARSSFPHARCCVPNSTSRSSRPSSSRIRIRADLSRSDARLSNTRTRPPCIRWISRARSPSKSSSSILPCRFVPVIVWPASADTGGSNVFIVTTPGASADSTFAPSRTVPSRRAQVSTSGSSGTCLKLLPQRPRQALQLAVSGPQPPVEVHDARVELIERVVLSPLVEVQALDAAAVLACDRVRIVDRPRGALLVVLREWRGLAGRRRVLDDAAGLVDPDLALLRNLLHEERGLARTVVVGALVVVEAPDLGVVPLADGPEECV